MEQEVRFTRNGAKITVDTSLDDRPMLNPKKVEEARKMFANVDLAPLREYSRRMAPSKKKTA